MVAIGLWLRRTLVVKEEPPASGHEGGVLLTVFYILLVLSSSLFRQGLPFRVRRVWSRWSSSGLVFFFLLKVTETDLL
jgi:hypothetical protein